MSPAACACVCASQPALANEERSSHLAARAVGHHACEGQERRVGTRKMVTLAKAGGPELHDSSLTRRQELLPTVSREHPTIQHNPVQPIKVHHERKLQHARDSDDPLTEKSGLKLMSMMSVAHVATLPMLPTWSLVTWSLELFGSRLR